MNKQSGPARPDKSRSAKTQDQRRAINQPLATKLRGLRKAAGLQQQELAARLGVRPNAVSNWETGLSRPDLGDFPLLCSLLGVTADELLGVSQRSYSSEDRQLLAAYHALDQRGQATVRQVMETQKTYSQAQLQARYDAGVSLRRYNTAAAAGYGAYLPEDEDYQLLRVDPTPDTCRADCIIPVAGDSMEPTYHNGDLVLVQQTQELLPGQVGVFVFDGEGYIKELGEGCLRSHNPAYGPIRLGLDQSVRCVGRVLGVLNPEAIVSQTA